ncbi:MAG: Hsp20/alpha crystallin family protein [Spirochaetales bacterium]|nr:Hsp20/alpha crystallin family protein [Spirochaetales bacterium]
MNFLVKRKPQSNLVTWGFDSFLDDFFSDSLVPAGTFPKVDVKEEDKQYVVEAELPGLTEKDIDVKVENNLLTISSKKSEEKEEKKEGYIIKERRASEFCRSFTLPDHTDREKIEAHYKNGLLTLLIPKTKEAEPKAIEIKTR